VIDAWYWLALINLRCGAWNAALKFLERIDGDEPGHRKVRARADAIRAWQCSMRARCADLRVEGVSGEGAARYTLRGEVARGPRATVYRALDRARERDVALKLFTPNARDAFGDGRGVLQRLARASRLRHPNVAEIYDFGELEGRLFVASELVEDDSVLASRADASMLEMLRRAEHVAGAVDAYHRAGVIHGAIKPPNLRVGRMGVIKLMDPAPVLPERVHASGLGRDALAFQAAGQLAGNTPTEACDIFSIGAWMYFSLKGVPPFVDLDREAEPEPLGHHRWLDEIVRQAVHASPCARYRSADELRAMIAHVLEQARCAGTGDLDTGDIMSIDVAGSEGDPVVLI
jgi:serine/threonine-protein kinase